MEILKKKFLLRNLANGHCKFQKLELYDNYVVFDTNCAK